MKIIIIQDQKGWPLVNKGEIYEVRKIRKSTKEYICYSKMTNEHIVDKYIDFNLAKIYNNNGQLTLF